MNALFKEIKYAIRSLLKRPTLTIVVVITMALGVGANTTIFSVVNSVLLRPLPYQEPDSVVSVWETDALGNHSLVSPGDYNDWTAQSHSLELSAIRGWDANVTSADEPVRLQGAIVTPNTFAILRVTPERGRTFLPEEDKAGQDLVVMLSHSVWERNFAADPNILDRTLTINGRNRRVVGVMPANFELPVLTPDKPPARTDIWVPFVMDATYRTKHDVQQLHLLGRLKSGASIQQAQTELTEINQRTGQRFADTGRPIEARVASLHETLVGNLRPLLFVLLGAVGFVFLIACANVANILLARAAAREKEAAIRAALGASRLRLIRQSLTESLVLTLCGGAGGLLLAVWSTQAVAVLSPEDLPQLQTITIDRWVLWFTFGLSVLSGIVVGLVPVLKLSLQDLNDVLKQSGRGANEGPGANRMRTLLVISELALAVVLLTGAGLMIKSVMRLSKVDAGFRPQNVLSIEVSLPSKSYEETSQRLTFYRQLLERVQGLGGVQSTGVVTAIPLTGWQNKTSFEIEGQARLSQTEELHAASAGYFQTIGIPLLKGRLFTEQDSEKAPAVAIVSQSLAQRYWRDENPVGKRIRLGGDKQEPWREIVGVVGDIRQSGLDGEATREYYISYLQDNWGFTWDMNLVVHTAGDPRPMIAAVKNELRTIDKSLPVFNVRTMEELRNRSVAPRRFNMLLLGDFAIVALAMAVMGIYGVISYNVAQRTREIGIRMALGAQTLDVLRLVIKNGMTLALIGVAIGLAGAFASTRLMAALLFEVTPTDAMTYVLVSVGLLFVALLACYIPARRATKVDPLVALRYE